MRQALALVASVASVVPRESEPRSLGAEVISLADKAREYAKAARAPATRRAYASDWAAFSAWCARHGHDPMPATPAVIVLYVTDMAEAGRKPATIGRHLATISVRHKERGKESPCSHPAVREVVRGVRRTMGTAQRKAAALLPTQLVSMLEVLATGRPRDVRDAALITLGWATACRRSELTALTMEDIVFVEGGVEVVVRRAKCDQEGKGHTKAVPIASRADRCPVRLLRGWLAVRGTEPGPLFVGMRRGRVTGEVLSGAAIADAVQRAATRAGLEGSWSGHSMRRGFCTAAVRAGKPVANVMAHTGHRSAAVFAGYVAEAQRWDAPAAAGLL